MYVCLSEKKKKKKRKKEKVKLANSIIVSTKQASSSGPSNYTVTTLDFLESHRQFIVLEDGVCLECEEGEGNENRNTESKQTRKFRVEIGRRVGTVRQAGGKCAQLCFLSANPRSSKAERDPPQRGRDF